MKTKIVLVAGLLCFLFFPLSAKAQERFDLTLVTFWPASHFQVEKGHERWIEEVEERTDGRVRISVQAGEALLGASEIYSGVAQGVADIGTTCPAYTPGEFPLMEAFELPGYRNENAVAASLTVNEGRKRIKRELEIDEFEEVKPLFFWATGPGDIMSSDPIRSLEDLQGMSIRSVGATVPPLERLGADPTGLPMSESYQALAQGIVDGILAPREVLEGFRLAEVVDYATPSRIYNVVFMKVMNKDTWNSLPPDVQQVFEELNYEFAYRYGKLVAENDRLGLEYARQEHGLEVVELSPEEEQRWRERTQPVVENWIRQVGEQGLPGRETVEIIRELDEKYSSYFREY